MRRPKPFPEGTTDKLKVLLKQAKTKNEFQGVQAVLLREITDLSTCQIAEVIGWHPDTVRRVQSRFCKIGEVALNRAMRGGRRRHYLTEQEERDILAPYIGEIESGSRHVVTKIKSVYESKVSRSVNKTTIYRLIDRHGIRKNH